MKGVSYMSIKKFQDVFERTKARQGKATADIFIANPYRDIREQLQIVRKNARRPNISSEDRCYWEAYAEELEYFIKNWREDNESGTGL